MCCCHGAPPSVSLTDRPSALRGEHGAVCGRRRKRPRLAALGAGPGFRQRLLLLGQLQRPGQLFDFPDLNILLSLTLLLLVIIIATHDLTFHAACRLRIPVS